MKFDCLVKDGEFITARPTGHDWSDSERAEFAIVTVDISPMPSEYVVSLDTCDVATSRISYDLVERAA